jgi:membrane protein DedA with SNARE-associated domain
VPGETALVAAGILAQDGRLDLGVVIVVAAAAAIVGDNIGYLIGRTGGRALIERPGPFAGQRRALLRRGGAFFDRHGPKAVFLGRWFAGLRIAASWLAGINRMEWRVFLFWNALGGIAWATTVGLAAYLAGHVAERILRAVGVGGLVAVGVLGAAVLLWRRVRPRE